MAYRSGILLSGGKDKILRIWDVDTGACLQELGGHKYKIVSLEIQKNLLLSGDDSGEIIIWDMASTMGKRSDDQPGSPCAPAVPFCRSLKVNFNARDVHYVVLGRSFVVVSTQGRQIFRVIDFP